VKLGTQAWVTIAILAVETIICFKYSRGEFKESMPRNIRIGWVHIKYTIIIIIIIIKIEIKKKLFFIFNFLLYFFFFFFEKFLYYVYIFN